MTLCMSQQHIKTNSTMEMQPNSYFFVLFFTAYIYATTIFHELEFGDIAVMQIFCSIVTCILILIGSLRCLKKQRQWTRYLVRVHFLIVFIIFINIRCRYTLELPQFHNVLTTYGHVFFCPTLFCYITNH